MDLCGYDSHLLLSLLVSRGPLPSLRGCVDKVGTILRSQGNQGILHAYMILRICIKSRNNISISETDLICLI